MITFTPIPDYKTKCVGCPKIGYNNVNSVGETFVPGAILEIDTKNTKNFSALSEAVEHWGSRDIYGRNIIENVQKQRKNNKYQSHSKIYALTLQQNNFNKLESSKILRLGEVIKRKKNEIEINFLQVKPESAGANANKEYYNIGRAIIKMLKRIPENRKIVVKADYRAANFYEKMKFVITNPSQLIYTWERMKGIRIVKP